MFRVKKHIPASLFQVCNGLSYHGKIRIKTHPQGIANMEIPGFPDDRHRFGVRIQKGLHDLVLLGLRVCLDCTAECHDPRLSQGNLLHLFKVPEILWVGSGPAPFNIVNSEVIELLGDLQFIAQREGDVLRLGSIAEGSVVKLYPHFSSPTSSASSSNAAWRA